jgi:hypothetical protein
MLFNLNSKSATEIPVGLGLYKGGTVTLCVQSEQLTSHTAGLGVWDTHLNTNYTTHCFVCCCLFPLLKIATYNAMGEGESGDVCYTQSLKRRMNNVPIRVIRKVTLSFTPYPLCFRPLSPLSVGICKVRKFY